MELCGCLYSIMTFFPHCQSKLLAFHLSLSKSSNKTPLWDVSRAICCLLQPDDALNCQHQVLVMHHIFLVGFKLILFKYLFYCKSQHSSSLHLTPSLPTPPIQTHITILIWKTLLEDIALKVCLTVDKKILPCSEVWVGRSWLKVNLWNISDGLASQYLIWVYTMWMGVILFKCLRLLKK